MKQPYKTEISFLVCVALSIGTAIACTDEKNEQIIFAFDSDGYQSSEPSEVVTRDVIDGVTVRAVMLESPLSLDGRLEEDIYQQVPSISDFIQQEPFEGREATEKTEVWVFFDARNIYVAARNWDSQPHLIRANELRRDNYNIFMNDNFAVIFDTFYDRRNGFLFHTNPLGALYDAQVTDERNVNSDWNTVWDVKTNRLDDHWTLEMAIPFKSLRYKQGRQQMWGINFRRIVRSKNEISYLTPIPSAFRQRGLTKLSFAASLVGIETPEKSLNLELKPYGTAGIRTDYDADVPFKNDFDPDLGLDMKYGVTKSLVADWTVNTDFAQVETDDQQVNLTRFSLFFPEKREFFLEGQGLFAFGGSSGRRYGGGGDTPILFFSRRIGIDKRVEVPIQTGARLTGRQGKYTLGLLNMQTRGVDAVDVEPTNFSVIRVKRDILKRSSIGIIATHRNKSIDYDGSNSVFGVDAAFSFYENLNINAYYAKSRTEGLTGQDESYSTRVSYGGDRYGFSLSHLAIGDEFNPEIGFVRRSDIRKTSGRVRFSPRPQSIKSVRKFSFVSQVNYYENGDGRVETREHEFEFGTEFNGGDNFDITYSRNYEGLFDNFEIADGVTLLAGGYEFDRVRATYRMGPQRKITGWFNLSTGDFFGGKRTEASYRGRVEVTPQLSFEPHISQNWISFTEESFTTTLLRLRSTYALSARSFAGALIQYNTSNKSISTNVRFAWEYDPGSNIFIVYTDGRDVNNIGFPELRNQSFVVKFTRLFRF